VNLVFTTNAWEDFGYWLDHDKEMAEKIRALSKDIVRNPFQGLENPSR
jgi:toxin YoeB